MKLYSSQFNVIAQEILRTLRKQELIEVTPEQLPEAELDIVGVLKEYNRMDRQLTMQARDSAGTEGRPAEAREKQRLAREKGFRSGEEGLEYIVGQILETFMQSDRFEEIYGTDRDLRRVVTVVLRKFTEDRSAELDAEVRGKLKNLQEGSTAWDIEYEKALKKARERKGLTD
jgi:hypothetical protein